MIEKRIAESRGATEIGWLNSRHSFSFGEYQDPKRTQHGPLRVLNDDIVEGGRGFGAHPHRNAEIVSYVLSGQLEHRDSMGNGGIILPGQFQYMSAGSGVTHSEKNPGKEPVHFLQIWLLPNKQNTQPAYSQTERSDSAGLQKIASNDGNAPIQWHSNAALWLVQIPSGDSTQLPGGKESGYLHVTQGEMQLGDTRLKAGDAVATTAEPDLSISALTDAEFLWFDLGDD